MILEVLLNLLQSTPSASNAATVKVKDTTGGTTHAVTDVKRDEDGVLLIEADVTG